MGYTLTTLQKAPLLDGEGNALLSADVTDPSGNHAPFATGLPATIVDEEGVLVCVGNHVGTLTFTLMYHGEIVPHDVTVTASGIPFDWVLGEPVAK